MQLSGNNVLIETRLISFVLTGFLFFQNETSYPHGQIQKNFHRKMCNYIIINNLLELSLSLTFLLVKSEKPMCSPDLTTRCLTVLSQVSLQRPQT